MTPDQQRDQTPANLENYIAERLVGLQAIHSDLARLIAPATPQAVRILQEQGAHSAVWRIMGPIRIVRQLMAFAILCLAAFVALSISTDAASEVSENLSDSVGAVAYLLTAAGLGAAFAALMKIGEYVTNVNYDEKYDFTYWQLIVLGLIAGVVLATLIPADVLGNAELATPLLALLGGFSATAVHKILNRLTDTLVTIVQGDKSQEAAIESKAASEKAASDALRIRLDVGARAMAIRNELNADVSVDRVANDLDSLFADYLAPYKDSLNGQN